MSLILNSKFAFVLLFLLSIVFTEAQGNFRQLSTPEKKWTLQHPFLAIKIRKKIKTCYKFIGLVKEEKKLDLFENGGKLDAFRHIFTMAYLAQSISATKLKSLGEAHEMGNREQFENGKLEHGEIPDSVSCQMDLMNNSIGITLGKKYKNLSTELLKEKIIEEINQGNAWIISRDETGNYVQCNGTILIINQNERRWNMPKCLKKTK